MWKAPHVVPRRGWNGHYCIYICNNICMYIYMFAGAKINDWINICQMLFSEIIYTWTSKRSLEKGIGRLVFLSSKYFWNPCNHFIIENSYKLFVVSWYILTSKLFVPKLASFSIVFSISFWKALLHILFK